MLQYKYYWDPPWQHATNPMQTNHISGCQHATNSGKFGGNYIWQNGFQVAKNKYWWNLNLAFGLFGSLHVVHGRVSTRELCLRPSHTQEHMDSIVGIVLQCKMVSGNIKDHSMPTPEAYSRCTCLTDQDFDSHWQRATNPKTKIFFNLTNAD